MSETMICKTCGATTEVQPDNISMWGMHDNHTFKRYRAKSVDDLINQWRQDVASDPDISLCPIVVMSGGKELRSVGEMLFPDYQRGGPKDENAVSAFREAAIADPAISRLIALSIEVDQAAP